MTQALFEFLACAASLLLAFFLLFSRKFGAGSWLLSLAVAAAALLSGWLGFNEISRFLPDEVAQLIAYALLVPFSVLGLFFTWTIHQADYGRVLLQKRKTFAGLTAAAPLLLAGLFWFRPASAIDLSNPQGSIPLGPFGYLTSLYLTLVSVMALAGLEQVIRGAEERSRWEIKFLVLGLGVSFATIIYVSAQVLLYSPQYALLSYTSLQVFPPISLLSFALIYVSARRSTGHYKINVSQSLVYSSITLLCVGIYLIFWGLFSRWASRWDQAGIRIEALVFLVAATTLGTVLLWTSFRHRVRLWIHKHVFSGKYDYRYYWMEATEKIRSVDSMERAAYVLAQIAQRALGAIAVSVWIRLRDSDKIKLLASLGYAPDELQEEIEGAIEILRRLGQPVSGKELSALNAEAPLRKLIQITSASILVPLSSGDRFIGLLALGSDRSGHPYDLEASEFLRVLSAHAAAELHKAELLDTLVEAKESQAFRNFASFVLHDLKNFASTLSMIARNAARYQENPEFQKDAFESIYTTAEKMKRLCNSLRTFSGMLAANKKPADLNQIVRSAADNLNAGTSEHLRLELGELPDVLVDSEEMGRVLQNLLLNAREAISAAGTIIVRTVVLGDTVEISVQDNGKGMTREFMENQLFLPFHTTKSGGLGIGLFQSKKIMEAHQGSILVESEEGRGTTVRLILPTKRAEALNQTRNGTAEGLQNKKAAF